MKQWLRSNGLSIVLFLLFVGFWGGQTIAGMRVFNDQQREYHLPAVDLFAYLKTGHFIEATAENWESEFLQMAAFLWLTAILFQKGSPESHDPDKPRQPEPRVTKRSPWPVRRGGWWRAIYGQSMSLAFATMFMISIAAHAWGGAMKYSHEQEMIGQPGVSTLQYLGTSQFWFESFENWQSEFLSIGCMVVLAIFLRQRGSPQSKPLATPHWENE